MKVIEITFLLSETSEKEVQILTDGGLGIAPSLKKSRKNGGYRGSIKTISAFSSS